jgi:multidrug efflux pump subunit AcrA (membrane-fusion protein)
MQTFTLARQAMPARGSQANATRPAASKREPMGGGAPTSPADYFHRLLALICEATNPRAAIAWGVDDHGVLSKIAEIVSAPRPASPDPAAARAGAKRLLDALVSEGPQVCPLGQPGDDGARDVEVLVPFRNDTRPCGVLEVIISQLPDVPAATDRAMAVLQEVAGYASHYLQTQYAPPPDAAPRFAEQLNELILELYRDPCVSQVSLVAVNEGRSLIGCDRTSLIALHGRRADVLAVSGQERVVTRSNLVRAMADLAAALGDAERPLRYDGQPEQLPPPLRDAVLEYVKHSGARRIAAYPLRTRLPDVGEPDREPRYETRGWLVCEDFQQPVAAIEPARAQALCDHVAVALRNVRQLESAATPFRRAMRYFFARSEFKSARHAMITACVVLAAIIGVGVLPVRYRVEARGRLLPVRRSELFAPVDGRVKDVLVVANQTVTQGQVLLRLDSERLANEVLTTRHQLEEKQQLLATLEAQAAETTGRGDNHESIRLSGAISQTKIEIASAQGRLQSLEAEAAELEVRSPIDGTVTTFEPERLLLNRPVARGEALLEVMDTTGPWQLQLDLPAKRVGHVLAAQAAANGAAVPVEFTLATQPDKEFAGALRTVSSRIVTSPDAESVAPLEVNVAVSDIAHPVAGADVIARVDCGNRTFARVLFGDVVDFFRRRVW